MSATVAQNIAGSVDCSNVAEYARGLKGVVVSRDYVYTCSEPGQMQIVEDIKKYNLTRVRRGIVLAKDA